MRNSQNLDKNYSPGSFRKTESPYSKPHHEKSYSARGMDFTRQPFMSMSHNEYKPNYKFSNLGYLAKMQEISTDLADVYEFRKRCFGKVQNLESAVERNQTTYENEISYLEEYINLLKKKVGNCDFVQESYTNCQSCREKSYNNSKLVNENEDLKYSLQDFESQYQSLKNENYNKRQEILQLSRQIHDQKDLTELFDIISSLEETKKQNEDYIQKIQEDKKHLEALLKQTNLSIESEEKTKEISKSQNGDKIEDMGKFKQDLQRKVDETIKMCEKKFVGTIERARILDEESARLGKISGVLKEKLKELQEKSRNWPDNESFSSRKFKELESENSKLEDKVDQLIREKRIIEEKTAKLEHELGISYEKAKKAKDELAISTEIIRKLEGKLEKTEEAQKSMKQEIERSQDIATKAQKSEQDLKVKHDKLCSKIQSKPKNPQQNIITQQSQDELKKEINSLNELIKAMNCIHKKLEDDKKDLIDQVHILKQELLKTQNINQEGLFKNSEFDFNIKELRNKIEKQKKNIENLHDQVETGKQAEEENKILRQQISGKSLEIEKLQRIIARSIENITETTLEDKKHMMIKKLQNNSGELEYLKTLTERCGGVQQDKLSIRYLDIIDELVEKIKNYVFSTDCLQESLSESESKISSYNEIIYKLEYKVKDLTETNYFQTNTIQSLQKKIEGPESPVLVTSQEHDQKILKLKQQLKNKKSEVEKLQDILQKSLKKLFSSDSESDKLRPYLQPKGIMSTKSLAKLRNVPTELIPMKSWEIIRDLIEKLDYVIKKNDELDEVLKSSHAKTQDLSLKLNTQKDAFDEYNELVLAKQILETSAIKDQKEKAKLTGEVNMLRAENKALMKKKLALKAKRDELLRKIEDLENDMKKNKTDFDKDQLGVRVLEKKDDEEKFLQEMQYVKEQLEIAQGLICDYEYAEQDLKMQLEKEKILNEDLADKLKNLGANETKTKPFYENKPRKMKKMLPKNNYEFENTVNDMKNIIDQEKYEYQQFVIELEGIRNSATGVMTKDESEALSERMSQQGRFIEELQEKLLGLEYIPTLVNQIDIANSEILTQAEELGILTEKLSKAEEKVSRQSLIIEDLEQKLREVDNYQEILNELLEANKKLDRQSQVIDELEEKLRSLASSGPYYKDSETLSDHDPSYKNPKNPTPDHRETNAKSLFLPISKTIEKQHSPSSKPSFQDKKQNPLIKKVINEEKSPENLEEAKSHILILRQALSDFQYKKNQQSGFTEEIPSEIILPEKEEKLLAKLKYQNSLITELENKNIELESRFNRIRNKNNILESNTKKYSENVEKVFKDVNKKLQVIEKNLNSKEERVQNVFNDYLRFKKKYIAGIQEKARALIENMQFGMEGFDKSVGMEKDDMIHLLKARVEFLQDKIDCLVKSNHVTKEIIENISDKAQDAIDLIKVE